MANQLGVVVYDIINEMRSTCGNCDWGKLCPYKKGQIVDGGDVSTIIHIGSALEVTESIKASECSLVVLRNP